MVDLFPHKDVIDAGSAQLEQQGSGVLPIEETEYPKAESDFDMITDIVGQGTYRKTLERLDYIT